MSCEYGNEKLEAYVLGLLDQAAASLMAEHIKICQTCQRELAGHQQAAALLDKAFDEEPAEWLAGKTLAKIKADPVKPINWLKWGMPVLAGAAAVMLMVLLPPAEKTDRYPITLAADLDIHLQNPINDRSLYEELGVATQVAKLLL
ncbi:hypothetical protein KAR10_06100 [bacterium]|nr:hypothetical protein [bacterium]